MRFKQMRRTILIMTFLLAIASCKQSPSTTASVPTTDSISVDTTKKVVDSLVVKVDSLKVDTTKKTK